MSINATATVLFTKGDQMLRQQAVCKDLSATGLSLKVTEALAEGDHVEVLIEGKDVQALDIKARVLRVSQTDDGAFIIGCTITSMR